MVSVFAATAFAADCKVNDSDINGEYVGGCVNGLAHGKGKSKGKDTYEGDFWQGNKHGKGTYVWSVSGNKYEGDWKSDNKNGSGTDTWHSGGGYIGQYKDDKWYGYGKLSVPQNNSALIEVWQNSVVGAGRKDSELVIFEGFFQDGRIILSCTSEDNCQLAKIKLQSEKDKKDTLEQTQSIVYFIIIGIFLVAAPWIMLRKKLIIFKIISNTALARTILMLIMLWFIAFIQSTFISLNRVGEFEFGFEEVINLIIEPLEYLFEYATEFDVILLIVGYPVLIWIINFIVSRS